MDLSLRENVPVEKKIDVAKTSPVTEIEVVGPQWRRRSQIWVGQGC